MHETFANGWDNLKYEVVLCAVGLFVGETYGPSVDL